MAQPIALNFICSVYENFEFLPNCFYILWGIFMTVSTKTVVKVFFFYYYEQLDRIFVTTHLDSFFGHTLKKNSE